MTIIEDFNVVNVDYVKDGDLHIGPTYTGNVQVESADDLPELVETRRYHPGALAHTAGYQNVWELGTDGVFAVVKSEE